jgi:hypothetical protein
VEAETSRHAHMELHTRTSLFFGHVHSNFLLSGRYRRTQAEDVCATSPTMIVLDRMRGGSCDGLSSCP